MAKEPLAGKKTMTVLGFRINLFSTLIRCQPAVRKWQTLQAELGADKNTKPACIRIVFQVRETMNEVNAKKLEDILYPVTKLNVWQPTLHVSRAIGAIRIIGSVYDQFAIHIAHSTIEYVRRAHHSPLELAQQRNAIEQEPFKVMLIIERHVAVTYKLAKVHEVIGHRGINRSLVSKVK